MDFWNVIWPYFTWLICPTCLLSSFLSSFLPSSLPSLNRILCISFGALIPPLYSYQLGKWMNEWTDEWIYFDCLKFRLSFIKFFFPILFPPSAHFHNSYNLEVKSVYSLLNGQLQLCRQEKQSEGVKEIWIIRNIQNFFFISEE